MMTTSPHSLSPKLEAVLAELASRLGPMFKTQAVKLPYLVDVVARHALGRPITEGTHQTWEHGVVTKEVYRFVKYHEGGTRFAVEPHEYSESGQTIRLKGEVPATLTDPEKAIVDYVAAEYGSLSMEQLGLLTKRMNTERAPEEWGSNHEARVDEEAYLRMSLAWQDLAERLSNLDLEDQSLWGEDLSKDPKAFVRSIFNA